MVIKTCDKEDGYSVHTPYTQEVDLNVNRKGLLEQVRLVPRFIICSCVHLVCKRDLPPIVTGQEANLVDHACKAGSSEISVRPFLGRTTPTIGPYRLPGKILMAKKVVNRLSHNGDEERRTEDANAIPFHICDGRAWVM